VLSAPAALARGFRLHAGSGAEPRSSALAPPTLLSLLSDRDLATNSFRSDPAAQTFAGLGPSNQSWRSWPCEQLQQAAATAERSGRNCSLRFRRFSRPAFSI